MSNPRVSPDELDELRLLKRCYSSEITYHGRWSYSTWYVVDHPTYGLVGFNYETPNTEHQEVDSFELDSDGFVEVTPMRAVTKTVTVFEEICDE